MSPQDSLYETVHTQFREAFGEPHNLLGGGEQWTLQPASRFRSGIHILLNGTPDKPGVWIFDPHDKQNGVHNTPITQPRQIGDLITLIQQRLTFANRKRRDTTPPHSPSGARADDT